MTYPDNEGLDASSPGPSVFGTALVLFALVAAFVGLDIAQDLKVGGGAAHVVGEGAAAAVALLGAALAGRRWSAERRAARAALALTRVELQQWRAEADRWRVEAAASLKGLSDAIDQQFERWGLTPAEREVALLLLKGLSFKEIAGVRDASERTVRQQAQAVYRKAGLAGRAELAAFFFEDLLVPATPPP